MKTTYCLSGESLANPINEQKSRDNINVRMQVKRINPN